jgi:hypothetical protein
MNFYKKLKCFSLASLSRIVQCLQVRQEPTKVKHLSGAPLWGRRLALHTNNRIGWKGLPGANTLAYYANLKFTSVKSFITLTEGEYCSWDIIKVLHMSRLWLYSLL